MPMQSRLCSIAILAKRHDCAYDPNGLLATFSEEQEGPVRFECTCLRKVGALMMIEIDGAHHLLATPRYKLFQPAEIVVGHQMARAHMLNLSAGGALIFVSNPPAAGTILFVQCGVRTVR